MRKRSFFAAGIFCALFVLCGIFILFRESKTVDPKENTVFAEESTLYIPVSTAADFMAISDWSKNYYLTQDLDFSGITVTKRGELSGILNGNGFMMKNIFLPATNDGNNALFTKITGKVENIGIKATVGTFGTALPAGTAILCSEELSKADNILVDVLFLSSAVTGFEASAFASRIAWDAVVTNCAVLVNNDNGCASVYDSGIAGFSWRVWGTETQRTVENIRLYSYTGTLTATFHSGVTLSGAEIVCSSDGNNRYQQVKDIYKTDPTCLYSTFQTKISDDFAGFIREYFDICDSILLLTENGCTQYSVIYEPGNREIEFAVEELQYFFEEATGLELEATPYLSGLLPSGKHIAVGVQPAVDKGLSFQGLGITDYALLSENQTIYIYGRTGYGVLNGTYAFLRKLFDLEIFYTDVYELECPSGDLAVEPFADTDGKVFSYSYAAYGEMRPETNGNSLTYAYRLGFSIDYYISGAGVHNALSLVSQEEYGTDHPEWFYSGTTADGYNTGTQLVFGADNFSMQSGSLVSVAAEKLADIIAEDALERDIYGISPMDINIWPSGSGYPVSEGLFQKYGTHSAEYILFMNALAKKLEILLSENGIERPIVLELLAYQKTLCPPDLSRDGLTEEDRAAVMLYQGSQVKVVPYIAPVEGNYSLSFESPENKVRNPLTGAIDSGSATVAEVIQGWAELSADLHLWWYSLDAHCYFMPLNTLDYMKANYQFAAEHNVTVIYSQTQHDTAVSTDWARLKMYLQSCLSEDLETDMETATEKFMEAYFGSGAGYMKLLLDDQRNWYRSAYENSYSELAGYHWLGTLFGSDWCTKPTDDFFWNKQKLLQWMEYVQSAKSAVNADVAIDDEEKAKLCARIDLESLTSRYILIKVFGYTAYDADLEAFYEAAEELGMTRIAEGQMIPSGL